MEYFIKDKLSFVLLNTRGRKFQVSWFSLNQAKLNLSPAGLRARSSMSRGEVVRGCLSAARSGFVGQPGPVGRQSGWEKVRLAESTGPYPRAGGAHPAGPGRMGSLEGLSIRTTVQAPLHGADGGPSGGCASRRIQMCFQTKRHWKNPGFVRLLAAALAVDTPAPSVTSLSLQHLAERL